MVVPGSSGSVFCRTRRGKVSLFDKGQPMPRNFSVYPASEATPFYLWSEINIEAALLLQGGGDANPNLCHRGPCRTFRGPAGVEQH
jgi:hypothetical protein